MSWRMWSVMSVIFCLFILLSVTVGLVILIMQSVNNVPWEKYSRSEHVRMVLEDWFPQIGADPENLKIESFLPWLAQGVLVDAIDFTFTMISMAFLTLLFLTFLLASDVDMMDNDDYYGLVDKVRRSVRRYMRIKTWMALCVSVLIGLILWAMKVDLSVLFAILTFVLSYIPHVGYTIAVLA